MLAITRRERWIPEGDEGTYATLRYMAGLVRSAASQWPVRYAAQQIVQSDRGVDACEAVRSWGANYFQFIPDPIEYELIHDALLQLALVARDGAMGADCDDAAVLVGALGASVGCGVRFTAVSFLDRAAPFAHVWASLYPPLGTGAEWIECDVTRPSQEIPMSAIARVCIYPVIQV